MAVRVLRYDKSGLAKSVESGSGDAKLRIRHQPARRAIECILEACPDKARDRGELKSPYLVLHGCVVELPLPLIRPDPGDIALIVRTEPRLHVDVIRTVASGPLHECTQLDGQRGPRPP